MQRSLALFLAAALALPAQQPPQQPAQPPGQQTLVFQASANLVIITVFVRDRDGKPVENLKREDFLLTENGKPQTISVFEFEQLSNETLPVLPRTGGAVVVEPATPAAAPAAAPVEPAPEDSSRFRDKRLLVLFFDWSGMQPTDQVRARESAEKFLREKMTTSDVVSIVTFSSRMKVEQEFTADRELLLKTIARLDSTDLAGQAETTDEEQSEDSEFFAADAEFSMFNTDRKLGALEDISRKLSSLPEKKAVIYFSTGAGQTGAENQSQLRSTINTAVRANVSFYPVDVRGLVALPPGGAASSGGGGSGTGMFSGQSQRQQRMRLNDEQETLYALASGTGGRALIDNNDLVMGIQQAQRTLHSYYVLGYYSTDARRDGQYRGVDVKLTSRQARLDFRRGYFAQKDFAAFSRYDKEKQLEDALLLGDPITELPIAVEVNWFRLARDRYFVPVAVKIPGSTVPLAKKGQAETTRFDFLGQVREAKGTIAGTVRDSIEIQLRQQNVGRLGARSLLYDTAFVLAPGVYRMKLLARENLTGKMGTFEARFTVPDLHADSAALRVSSVVVGTQQLPVSEAVGVADRKAAKKQEQHPMVRDGKKLLPSVTRVFRNDQSVFFFAEVYDAAALGQDKQVNVTAALSLYGEKEKVRDSRPVTVRVLRPDRTHTAALLIEAPLTGIAPGRYAAQLNVIDVQGQKFAFPRVPIAVTPADHPAAPRSNE